MNVEKDGSLAAKFLFPEGHIFVDLLLPSKQIYVNFYMIEHNLRKIPRSVPPHTDANEPVLSDLVRKGFKIVFMRIYS